MTIFYLIFRANYISFIIAGVINEIQHFLDCLDGSLARIRDKGTPIGYWLKKVFDTMLFYEFTLFGFFITIAIYKVEQNIYVWPILFLNIFGVYFSKVLQEENKILLSEGDKTAQIK